jgi:hypothetical protein
VRGEGHYLIIKADALFLVSSVKKECKSPTCKFQGSPKTVKFDEVYEQEEFTVRCLLLHLLSPC